jgi:hypothetical protein
MNPDLPQFDPESPSGWSEVTSAFDLAPLVMSLPVAIQVIGEKYRTLVTGIITSTEDTFLPDSPDNTEPSTSTIFFRDAESITIRWREVQAVIAMVAVPLEEEERET